MKLQHLLIATGLALGLTACGGDDDHPVEMPVTPVTPTAPAEVPASATVSTTAYRTYAASLVNSETATPLDVNKVVAPTSETEVAQPI